MAIRQDRYVAADTNKIKKVDIIEAPQVPDDPVLRRSDVQQQVSNSTLPASSRAVNLAIESINSNLDLKADKTELEGLATEDYVNEKIGEKEIGITEPELISKSVGSDKWLREGAYGLGVITPPEDYNLTTGYDIESSETLQNGFYRVAGGSTGFPAYKNSGDSLIKNGWGGTNWSALHLSVRNRLSMYSQRSGNSQGWVEFYSTGNTSSDKNSVLHRGTGTPIDTLNTSDMADTVVDNDLLTVTSGAVFRAIKQLTDQITSLEARVRELEDGGV